MKKLWMFCVAAMLACSTASAVDLSGEWTSGVTLTSGSVSMVSTFTLHLAGPGWQFASSWDPALLDVSRHSLVLKSSLGPLGVTAGASFRLATRAALVPIGAGSDPFLWSADGFSFRGGFVSLELAWGNLTLRLTFISGPEE